MERHEIIALVNRPVQIHFGDDCVVRAVLVQVNLLQFKLTDEVGPAGWTPFSVYDIAQAKWMRPWPPVTPGERYLYDVAELVADAERVLWDENRFKVSFANHLGSASVDAEHNDGQPILMLSNSFSDDTDGYSPEDRSISTTWDPRYTAAQIRHFLSLRVH